MQKALPQVSMAEFLLERMEQQRRVLLCLRESQTLTELPFQSRALWQVSSAEQSSRSSAALEGEPVSQASSSEETAIPRTDP